MLVLTSLAFAFIAGPLHQSEGSCCGAVSSELVPRGVAPSAEFVSKLDRSVPVEVHPELWAVEWRVEDPISTGATLAEAFGFEPDVLQGREVGIWSLDDFRVVLRKSRGGDETAPGIGDDSIQLNLEVEDLAKAMERARRAGLVVGDRSRSPVGGQAEVRLAEGQRVDLMSLDPEYGSLSRRGEAEIGVFCVSLLVDDVEASRSLWASLGWTGERFPSKQVIVPLEGPGPLPVVLHGRTDVGSRGSAPVVSSLLLFETTDLDPWVESVLTGATVFSTPVGRGLALGEVSEVPLRLVERNDAQLAFERIRALEGVWEGRSTAGWHAECEYQVIAGGSVVAERTNFEAHPGDTMMTLFHMDDGRLLLTHYCVAGNQPRLVATDFRSEGTEVDFEFLDGTNLPTRDHGHMDSVKFRFPDRDRLHSRWSWYQDGAEGWMEEIELRRAMPESDSPVASPTGK